jgi:hypothetical protein
MAVVSASALDLVVVVVDKVVEVIIVVVVVVIVSIIVVVTVYDNAMIISLHVSNNWRRFSYIFRNCLRNRIRSFFNGFRHIIVTFFFSGLKEVA